MQIEQEFVWLKASFKTVEHRAHKIPQTNKLFQFKRDYSLFCKEENEKMCAILVYVDDILITGDDIESIAQLKIELNKEFTSKDLGEMIFFLGLKVCRTSAGSMLSQRKYIRDIVRDAGLEFRKECKSPFPHHIKLSTDEGDENHA